MPDPADLFTRWELGLADDADAAALADLLQDPGQRRAFVRQARVAALLAGKAGAQASPQPVRSRRFTWALAASLLCALGLAAVLIRTHRTDGARLLAASDGSQAESAEGIRRSVHVGAEIAAGETLHAGSGPLILALPRDAARLELSAGARLSLPVGDLGRGPLRIDLAIGEVRAEVAPRVAEAPLAIVTPHGRAEVVGTGFTLLATPDATRLAVTSGAVRLSAAGSSLMVGAGQVALAADDLVTPAPAPAGSDPPLPPRSQVLWRAPTNDATGWNAILDRFADEPAWRSVPVRPGDRWSVAEVRSPITRTPWRVGPGSWLRFRYWTSGFIPSQRLSVHLKPADETNYAASLVPESSSSWHVALLRLDRDFKHIGRQHEAPAAGELIHGAVWAAQSVEGTATPVRFWIRDVVVFSGD